MRVTIPNAHYTAADAARRLRGQRPSARRKDNQRGRVVASAPARTKTPQILLGTLHTAHCRELVSCMTHATE